jgi:protein phosphatase
MVEDEDIADIVRMLKPNLPLLAAQLIEAANDNGGRDNVSVILIKVKGDFATSRGLYAKFLSWFKN